METTILKKSLDHIKSNKLKLFDGMYDIRPLELYNEQTDEAHMNIKEINGHYLPNLSIKLITDGGNYKVTIKSGKLQAVDEVAQDILLQFLQESKIVIGANAIHVYFNGFSLSSPE